jgi:hypothetical protein
LILDFKEGYQSESHGMTSLQEFRCEICGRVTNTPNHWFVIRAAIPSSLWSSGIQVKTELKRSESPVVLDLEEFDLIDLEGVRLLNACEA